MMALPTKRKLPRGSDIITKQYSASKRTNYSQQSLDLPVLKAGTATSPLCARLEELNQWSEHNRTQQVGEM